MQAPSEYCWWALNYWWTQIRKFSDFGGGGSRRGGCNNSISITVCQNSSPLLMYQTIAFALSNPFLSLFQEDFFFFLWHYYTDANNSMKLIWYAKWVCTFGWGCRYRFLLVGSITRNFRYWKHPHLSQLSGLPHARHIKGHFALSWLSRIWCLPEMTFFSINHRSKYGSDQLPHF